MTNDLKYIVSKETVAPRRWGSLTQKFRIKPGDRGQNKLIFLALAPRQCRSQ